MSSQCVTFPLNPDLQEHAKLPSVFAQLAFEWHAFAESHSLISLQFIPSPVYPAMQEHTAIPLLFKQVALLRHPPWFVLHGLTS
jgi:hypothetical protein